jgi:hypothetical protein
MVEQSDIQFSFEQHALESDAIVGFQGEPGPWMALLASVKIVVGNVVLKLIS